MFCVALFCFAFSASAQTVEELRRDIDQKSAEIQQLEAELKEIRETLATTKGEKLTLQAEVNRLQATIKKLQNDIAINEKQIDRSRLEIQKLSIEIDAKESSIAALHTGLATLIQNFAEHERQNPLIVLLKYRALSEFFRYTQYLTQLKKEILTSLESLRNLRGELVAQKVSVETKRKELETYRKNLTARRGILEDQKQAQAAFLAATRNKEKEYQALLKEREARRAALQEEIFNIEEKIRVTIDPASLPPKRSGVLAYPLPEPTYKSCWKKEGSAFKNCVTQYFGFTSFAKRGGYNGKGHNGTDFRADIGTPVFAAEDGIVTAWGNTDFVDVRAGYGCRGASYGKWILIEHPNNLSTLYAHLSSITVNKGEKVTRGEQIGFSGKSGYATGPHLHFTVFATRAVEITTFKSRVCGRDLTIPIAATEWYLDPGDYL